ncbi:lytic murein transglycosylase B [Desulfopila sp. IMCC35006]|uniref:lytic murein transglycosylase B n=1 Tax=Desulfopila sp. IMCC35006 TaxID=2569542 RepID=UPI0010ABCC27|nr:lytic murein transglycosylase B [Desulfopila sp. IMCC35006]TKB26292.1 lytic murein transglycosylase B [Desulfopila sp. IMCC35006]
MFITFSFLRLYPCSCNHPFLRSSFLKRIAVCGTLAFSLFLSACGGHQDDSQRVIASQQPQHLATETRKPQAPVGSYSAQSVSGHFAGYASVNQFIEEMAQKHGFERDYLRGLFSQAQRKNWTLRYLTKSDQAVKGKPFPGGWTRYRAKFVDEKHIVEAVDFAQNYSSALQRASRQYGVPEEYILAILAVETRFGGNVGNHRVIDALTTLSFDYARRGEYFQSELEKFLLMTRNEGLDPAEPVGSFAGAMGLGQFMPSSFLTWAVDFNMDGHRDLWDPEDAIGSIANYFAQHGWKSGQPVVTPLLTRGTVALEPGLKKQYTMAEIERAGLHPARPDNSEGPFHLLLLHHAGYDQYLIGHPDFYTITRYNHSVYYAMAVHELAQAIKQRL